MENTQAGEMVGAEAAAAADEREAPGDLRLVQLLLNTVDFELGSDELSDPAALSAWLQQNGLPGDNHGAPLGEDDLRRTRELREALRDVMGANSGEPVPPESAAVLERESERAALGIVVGGDGLPRLESCGLGMDGVMARLLAAVVTASIDGSWRRLKACRAHTCRWAFYDRSRNGSGTWCSMATCGNRDKARRHRSRKARAGEGASPGR